MPISMCKKILLGIFCIFSIFCQSQDFNELGENLILDLAGLAESYITPAAEGVAHQTTNGWFSTAKISEQPWQITASVQGNLLFIPNKRRTFLVDESQLRIIRIVGDETTALSPTSIGDDNTIELEANLGDFEFSFETPEGIDENTFWQAQLQVGVTLPFKSEILVRYAPEISVSDVKYQSYGIGIHHNISQWFKSIEESSWSFSTLVNYSKFEVSTPIDELEILGGLNSIEANNDAFGFNFIGSKMFNNFTFSGALNFTTSSYDYSFVGIDEGTISQLNDAISIIDNSDSFVIGNIAVRYDWDNLSSFTSFSFGEFQNLIVGINYTFNRKSKVQKESNK